ncbi:MAG: shikimate kinase [Flavobacteriaceae bacterium]|nr:shikimate kinase [Flavobacteriaceae bacterium]
MKKSVVLLGYMGSGKSSVASLLAKKMNLQAIDLDQYIEGKEKCSIPEIFKSKGEIYFRKMEASYLSELLFDPTIKILSLGGGTPCFGNNMERIKSASNTTSIYLSTSIKTLTERLFIEKESRPLISHLKSKKDLEDFIRKHLFERSFYYHQADIAIETDDKTTKEIVEEIRNCLL